MECKQNIELDPNSPLLIQFQLSHFKLTKPKYIRLALNTLPPTLDATYKRILQNIGEMYTSEALTLLRWRTFSVTTLSPWKLAETVIVDSSACAGVEVDIVNRGALEDTWVILNGLVPAIDINPGSD